LVQPTYHQQRGAALPGSVLQPGRIRASGTDCLLVGNTQLAPHTS